MSTRHPLRRVRRPRLQPIVQHTGYRPGTDRRAGTIHCPPRAATSEASWQTSAVPQPRHSPWLQPVVATRLKEHRRTRAKPSIRTNHLKIHIKIGVYKHRGFKHTVANWGENPEKRLLSPMRLPFRHPGSRNNVRHDTSPFEGKQMGFDRAKCSVNIQSDISLVDVPTHRRAVTPSSWVVRAVCRACESRATSTRTTPPR